MNDALGKLLHGMMVPHRCTTSGCKRPADFFDGTFMWCEPCREAMAETLRARGYPVRVTGSGEGASA